MPEWLMLLNMPATLRRHGLRAFSETARSRPAHGEAVRHRAGLRGLSAEGRRGPAHDVRERAAERAEAGEADRPADVGHAALGVAEQGQGPLPPPALQVAVGRLP